MKFYCHKIDETKNYWIMVEDNRTHERFVYNIILGRNDGKNFDHMDGQVMVMNDLGIDKFPEESKMYLYDGIGNHIEGTATGDPFTDVVGRLVWEVCIGGTKKIIDMVKYVYECKRAFPVKEISGKELYYPVWADEVYVLSKDTVPEKHFYEEENIK